MGVTQIYVRLIRETHGMVDSYEMNWSWSGYLNSDGLFRTV